MGDSFATVPERSAPVSASCPVGVELDAGAGQILAGQKALRLACSSSSRCQMVPQTVGTSWPPNPQYQALLGGMQAVVDGIGNPTDATPTTIFGGLNLIRGGLMGPVTAGAH